MKLKRKALSLLIVAVLLISALSVGMFASDSSRPSNARFDPSSLMMDPGDVSDLSYVINPSNSYSYDDVSASSSDNNVCYAEVSSDGRVTVYAYEPGDATVTLKISGSSVTATARISVRGATSKTTVAEMTEEERSQYEAGLTTYRSESSRTTASSSSSTSSKATATTSASTTIKLTEKAPREDVIAAAQSGTPLRNFASVSAESLQAASGTVHFDTRDSASVVGRLSITTANAGNLTGDILTGVYVGTGNTRKVQNTFDKAFATDKRVILCDQASFGMDVKVVAKVGSLKVDNLHFYSYNASTNSYAALTVSNVTKDANNYLHFTTSTGGYIIVSDGALA